MKKYSLLLLFSCFFLASLSAEPQPSGTADNGVNAPSTALPSVEKTYIGKSYWCPNSSYNSSYDRYGIDYPESSLLVATYSTTSSGITADGHPKYQTKINITINEDDNFKGNVYVNSITLNFDKNKVTKIIDDTLKATQDSTLLSSYIIGSGKSTEGFISNLGHLELALSSGQELKAGETLQFTYEAITTDEVGSSSPDSIAICTDCVFQQYSGFLSSDPVYYKLQ